MPKTIYWLQGGSCGGDTWSLFNADTPDIIELFDFLGLDLLWHQSLSALSEYELHNLNSKILSGEQPLDIFCLEGSVIHGPGGNGRFDMLPSGPKKDLIQKITSSLGYTLPNQNVISEGDHICYSADDSFMNVPLQYLILKEIQMLL